MEKQGLARKEYWDDFYIDGDGCSEVYEWYTGFETVEDLLTKYISENEFILHIGCGNSLLAEQILGSNQFPNKLTIHNIDMSDFIIEKMNDRLDKILSKESFPYDRRFKREQISYDIEDVCNMQYEDESYDIVLDKGLLDAVLSHGEDETGENEVVKAVIQEVYRVLKKGGQWLIFSGNDTFITNPYFFGDETVEWDVEMDSFQSRDPFTKKVKTLYYYVLTPNK